MQIGVVSEGPADFAVVRNIIKGALGLDASEVHSIRPELQSDETDRNAPNARSFSNWRVVREECEQGTAIELYLGVSDERLVVAHIDSAECELEGFDVVRPERNREDYVSACRAAVHERAQAWLKTAHRVVLAIAVEETDAWLLPLYAAKLEVDTGRIADPKKRLHQNELPKSNELSDKDRARILKHRSELQKYHELSTPLRKQKALRDSMRCNASLDHFVRSLVTLAESIEPGVARFAP